jgi:hypothetical protein
MAGNLTVEQCGKVFHNREASANYGIGTDGSVGLYVEESNAAWTSSNYVNDNRAVTIEVANDGGANWSVSDAAYAKLIELCVDICKRNNIGVLTWTGDATGTLTVHRMFTATTCPGDYLYSRMSEIAKAVNKQLSGTTVKKTEESDLKEISIPEGTVDVYRLYNKNNGQHMFTTSKSEKSALAKSGWTDEGIGWRSSDTGNIVYRLYNPNTGDHMFTVSFSEAQSLTKSGWTYEGSNFAAARKGNKVYRLYNSNNGQHTFTTSTDELNSLVNVGWKNEGTAFYTV